MATILHNKEDLWEHNLVTWFSNQVKNKKTKAKQMMSNN